MIELEPDEKAGCYRVTHVYEDGPADKDWVKVPNGDYLSGGKIGYLHIQAMNAPSLRKFEKEIRESRDKQALIIDQRWNGGGNIDGSTAVALHVGVFRSSPTSWSRTRPKTTSRAATASSKPSRELTTSF